MLSGVWNVRSFGLLILGCLCYMHLLCAAVCLAMVLGCAIFTGVGLLVCGRPQALTLPIAKLSPAHLEEVLRRLCWRTPCAPMVLGLICASALLLLTGAGLRLVVEVPLTGLGQLWRQGWSVPRPLLWLLFFWGWAAWRRGQAPLQHGCAAAKISAHTRRAALVMFSLARLSQACALSKAQASLTSVKQASSPVKPYWYELQTKVELERIASGARGIDNPRPPALNKSAQSSAMSDRLLSFVDRRTLGLQTATEARVRSLGRTDAHVSGKWVYSLDPSHSQHAGCPYDGLRYFDLGVVGPTALTHAEFESVACCGCERVFWASVDLRKAVARFEMGPIQAHLPKPVLGDWTFDFALGAGLALCWLGCNLAALYFERPVVNVATSLGLIGTTWSVRTYVSMVARRYLNALETREAFVRTLVQDDLTVLTYAAILRAHPEVAPLIDPASLPFQDLAAPAAAPKLTVAVLDLRFAVWEAAGAACLIYGCLFILTAAVVAITARSVGWRGRTTQCGD